MITRFVAALLLVATPASAQTIGSLFTSLPSDFAQLFTPTNGIVAGIGGAGSLMVHPVDGDIQRHIYEANGARHDVFHGGSLLGDGYAQGAIALGAYIVGRASHHPGISGLGADLVDAQIVNGVLTQGLKVAVDRRRPTGSKHSFPSGHTSATFATAQVIDEHFGWKAAAPFYALGGYVSVSRLVDNQHWASDVIFGAALGMVSGRAASRRHGPRGITVSPMALPHGLGFVGHATF